MKDNSARMFSLESKESSAIAPNRLDQMKRFDPLKVFPQEIWTSIIVEVASESRSNNQAIISQEVLLDLSHVSSHWESMLSSNSVLWADIVVENTYDAAARIAIGLHYSRTVPLSLYIYPPNGSWTAVSETILLNKGRITKLYLDNSDYMDFFSILADLSPLESLMSIHFGGFHSLRVERKLSYLSGLPIRWVDNLIFTKETLQQLDKRQLRNITIKENLDTVISTLEEFESLQDVELDSTSEPETTSVTQGLRAFQKKTKRLPWKTLRYKNGRTEPLVSMVGQLSGLVSLEVSLTLETFKSLIPLVYLLGKLNFFEMHLRSPWTVFDRPFIYQTSDSVKVLALHSAIGKSGIHQLIAQVMLQCFPHVRDFRLTTWRASFIAIYVSDSGFRYLNTLTSTITMPRGAIDEQAKPLPRTLKRLTYYCRNVSSGSFPFYSPEITHLNVFPFASSDLDMYNPAWPALQVLEIGCAARITWKGPAFLHLSSISLGGREDSPPQRVENATKLCRDVALHPNYLPALRKLKLAVCPEWDILLILLEGRNITTYPGISRITSLEIPLRCPPLILEHFKALIKSTVLRKLSYYSVSLASAYEIVRDASIPGCAECHRALRFCNAPVKRNSGPSSVKRFDYPHFPLEILRSWEGRADKWYYFEDTLRVARCATKYPLVLLSD